MEIKNTVCNAVKKGRARRKKDNRSRRKRSRSAKARPKMVTQINPKNNMKSPVKCAVHAFLQRYQSALRKVPSQLPPKIHAGPPSKRVKRVSWCKF